MKTYKDTQDEQRNALVHEHTQFKACERVHDAQQEFKHSCNTSAQQHNDAKVRNVFASFEQEYDAFEERFEELCDVFAYDYATVAQVLANEYKLRRD